MSEIEIKQLDLIEAEQHHHIVLMNNASCKEFPLALGFANDQNEVLHMVLLDLPTANQLGEKFCEVYNDTLRKVRGDQ